MKIPRKVKMYSPYAKKHTLHEIEVVKKKRASELARGQRKFRSVTSGYGGFPRPKPEGREKPTKRVYVRVLTGQSDTSSTAVHSAEASMSIRPADSARPGVYTIGLQATGTNSGNVEGCEFNVVISEPDLEVHIF